MTREGKSSNVVTYNSIVDAIGLWIFAIADVVGKSHLIRERTDTLDAIGITTDLLLWFFWHSLVPFFLPTASISSACSDRTFVREYHKKLPRFISAFSPNHAVLRRTSGPTRRSTKVKKKTCKPVRKDIDECSSLSNVLFEDEREKKKKCDVNSSEGGKVVRCAIDEVMKEDEKVKEQINRKDYWLCEGIVVKVMRKGLDNKGYYYKQRGMVVNVIDMYLAEIEMLERKDVIRARAVSLKLDDSTQWWSC
ncbi:hypothetical protein IFM89_019380 [Coptis chinensis]|uniref:KN17 SH3-like domain-containing protein n=1 Tax=Coptis chinensis TaxID=261450 RepID=A0A835IDA4_9MAGN|nr:hypothetical protein IFM89_019380 [Coptis chinensis]